MTDKEPVEQQFFGVVSQYVKDLSFEIVNAASRSKESEKQPQIDIRLDVKAEKCEELSSANDAYTVGLLMNISAKSDKQLFILELEYVGEFMISAFPDDILDQILHIECPRLLFPFARSIIASTISEGGFPPLYLAPVDFVQFYEEKRAHRGEPSA
ncbi:MAG: protein-export chaperone SecB [Holosporaceae bacterium]|nr:protein-export chaperone SecB [Holosporaceae bacterium]